MVIYTIQPYSMPCPKKPRKGLIQSINEGSSPILMIFFLILTLLLLPRIIPAIPMFTGTFSHSFGEPHTDDNAQALLQTSGGDYLIAGRTYSHGAGNSDAWLIKTNSYGKLLWNATFGGSEDDWATAVVETQDEGFIFTGSTNSFGNEKDIWVVKVNTQGIEEWQHTYGGSGDECGYDVIEVIDGFVVVGYTSSYGAGGMDLLALKLNEKGEKEWQKTFGGVKDDLGEALIATPDGGYVLGGQTWSSGGGGNDMWLVKLTSGGAVNWSITYSGPEKEWIKDLVLTSDGGFAFVGQSWTSSIGQKDVWLVKTDEVGYVEWQQTYRESEKNWAEALIQTQDQGYAFAGFTSNSGIGDYVNMWLVKTDNKGILLWSQQYSGASEYNDVASALIQTEDGEGFVLTGINNAPWFKPYYGGGDICLIKTNRYGELLRTDSSLQSLTPVLLSVSSIALLVSLYQRKKRKEIAL